MDWKDFPGKPFSNANLSHFVYEEEGFEEAFVSPVEMAYISEMTGNKRNVD